MNPEDADARQNFRGRARFEELLIEFSSQELEGHALFEALLGELSSRFVNVAPDELDREIEDALRRLCEHLNVDLGVLWQWPVAAPGVATATHVYYAQDRLHVREPLHQEMFPWVAQELLAGRIVAISSLPEGLPAEAIVDGQSASLLGLKSNLTLPLSVGGKPPIGALAFNTTRAERDWPDALVGRLRLIAQVFANALARRRADLTLRESEEISRATFEQAAVGLAQVGIDGRWLRVNDKLCAIVGYPREELLQLTFQHITHSDDLETDLDHVRQVLSGKINTYSMEKRYIRKDRSLVWINLTVSLIRTAAGEPRHFISVVEDITERKRSEDALRASQARLAAGADLAGLAFYEVDFAEGTTFYDDRVRTLWGVPEDLGPGIGPVAFWMAHLHPDDRRRVLDEREQLNSGKLKWLSTEYRFLNPTAGERWIHHLAGVAIRDAAGRAIRTFGVFRDITERKRAEEDLRSLSRRLIRAQEDERALLARELHDDVTQRLAVLAIEAGRADLAGPGELQAETMRAVREGLVRLSEDIHSLAYQLHPSVLEELGLGEALRAECERRGRQSPIVLSVDIDPALPVVVGRDSTLCLYRVAQEALSNVIRHAGARAASVVLKGMDGGLLLAVRDDGVGFDLEGPKLRRSLGLASMRERLLLVNGTLDIESAPGHGTAIVAWVPAKGES